MRSTANDDALGGRHTNEWAMDYRLYIPVHGQALRRRSIFRRGHLTIAATKLGVDRTTSDAVHLCRECRAGRNGAGRSQGDTSVTFRRDTSAKPEGLSVENGGYRFMGWFREPMCK